MDGIKFQFKNREARTIITASELQPPSFEFNSDFLASAPYRTEEAPFFYVAVSTIMHLGGAA